MSGVGIGDKLINGFVIGLIRKEESTQTKTETVKETIRSKTVRFISVK